MPIRSIQKIVLTLLLVGALACKALTPASKPDAAAIEREEQAVYSVLVHAGEGPAVLLQDTETFISPDDPQTTIDYVRDGLKSLSKDTLDNYLERNAEPSQLSPDMQLDVEYVLLSDQEQQQIFRQPEGWEVFQQKYPGSGGYTALSRVGFNKTLNQALVYVGNMAGPLMGGGFYYLLEKENGKWFVKEQVMVWIS